MSFSIQDLLELLQLEPLEVNIYRGYSRDVGSGRVFGGQVLAQALVAARRTVDEERHAHSMHGYFILPGDLHAPIVYFVDRLRDGKSFTTRRVTAIQHGRAIFNMSVSFQVAEDGVEHQMEMPDVPPPDSLASTRELARRITSATSPEPVLSSYAEGRPIEFRPVEPIMPGMASGPEARTPRAHTWFRVEGELPDDPLVHQAVLAYASDYTLLATALRPHGLSFRQAGFQAATLDHALWLHRPFRMDDWLLYATDSPAAAGARGFTRGAIFQRDGTLIASVAQEGLLRLR